MSQGKARSRRKQYTACKAVPGATRALVLRSLVLGPGPWLSVLVLGSRSWSLVLDPRPWFSILVLGPGHWYIGRLQN